MNVKRIAEPSIYWMWAVRAIMFLTPLLLVYLSQHIVTKIQIAILVNNDAIRQEMANTYLHKRTWENWKEWVYEQEHRNDGE